MKILFRAVHWHDLFFDSHRKAFGKQFELLLSSRSRSSPLYFSCVHTQSFMLFCVYPLIALKILLLRIPYFLLRFKFFRLLSFHFDWDKNENSNASSFVLCLHQRFNDATFPFQYASTVFH